MNSKHTGEGGAAEVQKYTLSFSTINSDFWWKQKLFSMLRVSEWEIERVWEWLLSIDMKTKVVQPHMNHTAISLRRISSCATLRVWNEFTGATFSSDNDDIWPNRRYSDLLCNKLRINIHKTQVWSFIIKCTSFRLSKSWCIISFFLDLIKSSKIGPQNLLSVGARTFFWLLVKNEFDLSPPSDCEESHLLVTVRTKDSCWSESQFYFLVSSAPSLMAGAVVWLQCSILSVF